MGSGNPLVRKEVSIMVSIGATLISMISFASLVVAVIALTHLMIVYPYLCILTMKLIMFFDLMFFTYPRACFYINSFHSPALHVVISVLFLIGLAKYNTTHRALPSSGYVSAAHHDFLPCVFLRQYVRTPNYSYIFSVIKWDKQISYLLVILSWAFYVAGSGVLL